MFRLPPARLMDVERWERIKDLCAEALELEEPDRLPFLIRVCQNDEELRLEVESLLSGEKNAGDFLKAPVVRIPVTKPTSDDSPSAFSAGQTISGRFKVLRFIAHGGMGEVYEAKDLELGERVALKTIRPEIASDSRTMARFKQEIQLARRVTHPNVCRMFDLERHQSETDPSAGVVTFLTMELLEGETLATRLGRVGRIAPAEAFPLVQQMASALAAAHDVGVVHRDFKPGNVMLVPSKSGDGKERAVVTDFGLAKAVAAADQAVGDGSTSSFTASGHIIGTLAYMAPEQLQGREATPASDIYALGLVMYEMVAGKRPYADDGPLGGARQPLAQPPASLRVQATDLDPRSEQAILHCLEVDPSKRFANARELCAALGAPPAISPRLAARKRLILMASFGLVFTLLLMTGVFFGSHPDRLRALWVRMFPPPLPSRQNLVVLPFRAVDRSPEEEVRCDGFTDMVTAKLTQAPAVEVAPAQSVRERHVDGFERARTQLGANLVLYASWQQIGKSAVIDLVLVEVDRKPERQLRSETIKGAADDVLNLRDEVVLTALRMLNVEISAKDQRGLITHGTDVPTAYEFYVQGLGYMQHFERSQSLNSAITLLKRAIEADPNYAQAHATLARAYWYKYNATNDPQWADRAKAAVKSAESLDSGLPEVLTAVGDLRRRTGDFAGAVADLEQGVKLNPNDADAHQWLGNAYDALGRTAQAEQSFRTAIRVRPGCWDCYDSLGEFLFRHARYEEARQAWQRVVDLSPDNVWGYMNVGVFYYQVGEFGRAADYFRRGLKLDPNNPDIFADIGTVSFFLRRYAEAAQFTEKAVHLEPDDFINRGNLADAYRAIPGQQQKASGNYRQAISLAEDSLRVNPKNSTALSSLALYNARIGNRSAAQSFLARALKIEPTDADVLRIACLIDLEADDTQGALKWLARAVQAGYPRGHLLANPELDKIRTDPEFARLASEAKTYN